GRGTLLTTEECLLDPAVQVRNPGFTRADYEGVLREALGATNVLWLGKGIAGDDTHGHVDDLARFVGPRTIVLRREPRGARGGPRAAPGDAPRGRREAGGRLPAHAGPSRLQGPAPARELRELLRGHGRRARPDLQRPERPRGPGDPGRPVPRPAGGRHPRGGAGVGAGHPPLPDPAAAAAL